ncbi:KilA-N domain-containing protein [Pseudomonas aeruginosa]|uniref:KilA-N domain-containing protein n=1 Tax=Pseudomonas aeruginosa TaxID=287 RepID=UPI000FC408E5|nr:KilA-N domain-containing protein [Pseudomonas aeruginosa]MEE3522900.1 KilA-N domain-containing protein [Pseudomonas aeruginosa]NBK29799.1 KilA-N domain-containing protein [Pseudomonas aeruginosa]NBY84166.1 KilA-N domain-containing protein [Pseudomonas aeruginosa]NPX03267.1 KilA-N domain-containing protein [Pseudomonas aeruginosa]RUK29019.1 KilA-N domain-containing protein [Pseudomonas aeruginosa]
MTQMDLPVIPHIVEGNLIHQRAADGYINATAMCQAAGKKFSHYNTVKGNIDFIEALSRSLVLPPNILVQSIKGGNYQGTWVHPQVAVHLAQWLSPEFAVQVTSWVVEWMAGGMSPQTASRVPVHLQRYIANRARIPNTHFSMLNELTLALIAPLEAEGYVLPEHMIPDISSGRMFSDWLRKERGIDPSTFPTYRHQYLDGRIVDARLYPNELLGEFRAYFYSTWMPKRCHAYFAERDTAALKFLPALLEKLS